MKKIEGWLRVKVCCDEERRETNCGNWRVLYTFSHEQTLITQHIQKLPTTRIAGTTRTSKTAITIDVVAQDF